MASKTGSKFVFKGFVGEVKTVFPTLILTMVDFGLEYRATVIFTPEEFHAETTKVIQGVSSEDEVDIFTIAS